jgi:hypothetical protein
MQDGSEEKKTPDESGKKPEESGEGVNQGKLPGEQVDKEVIPTLEQAIDKIRDGMKKPVLDGIKNELVNLETEHHVGKIKDEEYAERKKELLDGQEKIKNDKLKVASLAMMVQFDDRGPVHYYAGELKAGEEVLGGATMPELYNMVNTLKFMIENQTMGGVVHGELVGMSTDLKKSLSIFLRDFIRNVQMGIVRTPMDRFPGGRR